MANESRFLGRQLDRKDGFLSQNNVGVFVDESGNARVVNGGLNVNDGTTVSKIISGTATFSMAATLGVLGSANFHATIDVPLTGAAVGDVVLATPSASVALDLVMQTAVLTANFVRMVGWWTATTGAHAAVNVPVRLTGFRF